MAPLYLLCDFGGTVAKPNRNISIVNGVPSLNISSFNIDFFYISLHLHKLSWSPINIFKIIDTIYSFFIGN